MSYAILSKSENINMLLCSTQHSVPNTNIIHVFATQLFFNTVAHIKINIRCNA